VSDQLDGRERPAVEAHVERCAACQQVLETLAADADTAKLRRLFEGLPGRHPHPDSSLEQWLDRLVSSGLGNRAPAIDGAETPAAVVPHVPGYQVLGELGRGGMGVVYKAHQISLNRTVALKMILAGAHASPKDRARFRAEAEAVAQLQHPHIVQVYEVREQDGLLCLAMEFVEGGSLARKAAGVPQPARPAAQLVETLSRAIHVVHERHIIHRDLKPANVLLTSDGVPKITDFGLAKRLDGEAAPPQSGTILGTPSYMAPEQIGDQKPVGRTADVYALGAILYELLTGRPPFKGEGPMDTVLHVLYEEPVPPSRLQRGVPRDLETICLKCLSREPGRRYLTAAVLADDLRRFLDSRPIHARPVGNVARAWKWARRRPGLAAMLASLLLVTGLGFAGVTGALVFALAGWQEAEEQQQRANSERAAAQEARGKAEANLYVSRIAQARLEWRLNNLAGVETLLDQCPPESRGWEWHYLKSRNHSDLLTLTEPNWELVRAVAFSPDGRRLATAGRRRPGTTGQTGPGFVKLWDATTGQPLFTVDPGVAATTVAISPDGRFLAANA
jgi:predicted Ser/Thr protein kinase